MTDPPGPGSSAHRALARGGSANLVGAALSALASLVVVVLITRGLDKTGAGVVFTVTSVFLVVETTVRLGTDVGVVHFVSLARGRGNSGQEVTDAIWACLIPVVFVSVVGAAAVAAIVPPVVHGIGGHGGDLHTTAMAGISAAVVPIAAAYDLLTAATRGLGSARPTVYLERITRPVLQIVGVAVASAVGAGAFVMTLAWIAPYVVVAPLLLAWIVRLMRRDGLPLRSTGWVREFPTVWRFTLPRSFTSVIQILLQRLDIVLVGALLGAAPAAVYTGATRFIVVGQLGNQAIAYAFQPQLARLVARQELDEARALFRTATTWIVSVNAPLYLTVCATAPVLIRLFGQHFGSGTSTMIVVTAASFVGTCCGLVDFVLITMGRTTWNLANSTASLVANVGLDLILIPHVGIIGAAVGWAAAIVMNNLVPLYQVRRAFGFSPVSGLWRRLIAVSALGFAAAPATALVVSGRSLPVVAAVVTVALLGYLALLWRWRDELGVTAIFSRAA